jgi:hypothetical protein
MNFKQVNDFLNQPYPEEVGIVHEIKSSLFAGLVVFLFLFGFRPFGLYNLGSNSAFEYAAIFGVITVVTAFLFGLVTTYIFKVVNYGTTWTLKKWLLYTFTLVICIGIANFLYASQTNDIPISYSAFLNVLLSTFMVGIVPIFFFGSMNVINQLRKNQTIAQEVSQSLDRQEISEQVSIQITSGTEEINIKQSEFLFAESLQNYVCLYLFQDGNVSKQVIRITMKELESVFHLQPSIMRCHRSFIVNRSKIKEINGNAQGLKLSLANLTNRTIPVSRSYVKKFNS